MPDDHQAAPLLEGSIFESLFLKGVGNDPELHAKLKPVGFDALRMEATYHPNVFTACLEVAAGHLWPDLELAEAQRRLGRSTTEGYQGTLAGSVVTATLKLMGPARLMKQMPKRMASGMNYGQNTSRELGPNHWEMVHDTRSPGILQNPEFVAGGLEAGLALAGVQARVEVKERTARTFTLDITW